jgi:hypothetical protein
MSLLSLFTSSSEPPLTRGRAVLLGLCTLAGLAAIDAVVNLAFAYPDDPKVTQVDQVTAYFEYGRSIEGKLARITRVDPAETAPITLAGWYQPLTSRMIGGEKAGPVVTFYGMSHSVRLAEALARTTNRYESRSVGAPGATVNWSYGAFQRDKQPSGGKVAVLSLMTANAPMVTTMTAMTWNSAFPMPYTADRYRLQRSELRAVPLPFESFPAYVAAFKDPQRWAGAREAFEANDSYYNEVMFRASVLDRSASFRLIRRAYGLHLERTGRARVMDQKQFRPGTEEVALLNAIVRSFAHRARSKGVVPVVYIVNNYGYSTMLYDALADTLANCGIPYLSSHTVVSPSDPRGYLPDSHFTDSNDDRMARALESVIDRELSAPTRQTPACPGRPAV